MNNKNLRNFYIVLWIAFFFNVISFIIVNNNLNSIVQFQHKENTCILQQQKLYNVEFVNFKPVKIPFYLYVFFGIDFILLLFSVEFLYKSFYEVFPKI